MYTRSRARAVGIAGICLAFAGWAQTPSRPPVAGGKAPMRHRATGTFEVKMNPLPLDDKEADATLGRFSIDKQFHGDLQGGSKGEMLSAGTAMKGSAGYVAIERVSGTLHGRTGAFALQHLGVMNRGAAQLSVSVVPDSGTGQLVGLAGKMNILIEAGKHSYDFEYSLPEQP